MTTPDGAYAPRVLVEAPDCQPWRFGLLSVANIIDTTEDHERNGIKYKPLPCVADVAEYVDGCDTLGAPNEKAPTDLDDQGVEATGSPFHLYTYLSCKTTTLADMRTQARDALNKGEQFGVERAVWEHVLAQPGCTVLNSEPGTAGALSVIAAIAALESYMAENYSCRALFHSDRATVPYAVDRHQLVVVGGQLNTFLGSSWAAYGGALNTGPDGTPAPDGHAWIYATSQLTLRRFPIDVPELEMILRLNSNEPVVIAERTYVPSVECACAAVLVCLGC